MAATLIALGLGGLLLILSPLAAADCPDKPAVANLDIERFSGVWNVIEESDILPAASKNMKCKHSVVRVINTDNLQIRIMDYNLTSRAYSESLLHMKRMKAGHLDGKFELLISKHYGLSSRYYVLGTDYDHYAVVVWFCFIGYDEPENFEYSAILSRRKTLSEHYLAEAHKLLPQAAYRAVDQTSCPQARTSRP